MPPRREDKPEGPSLLPSDAPFGPPPKAKRRLFGERTEAGTEEPLPGDAAAEPTPPAPPRPTPPRRRDQTATDSVPNPDEHELEFVFVAGAGGTPAPPARAPVPPPVAVTAGGATLPPVERRGLSRGTLVAIVALLLLVAGVAAYALLSGGDEEPVPTIAPRTAPTVAPTTAPTPTPAAAALTEECTNSFLFAQANSDDPQNLRRTADFCPTAAMWLQAARSYPGAVGASTADEVGPDDVERLCRSVPASTMCRDAEKEGVLGADATPTASPAATPAASPAEGSV